MRRRDFLKGLGAAFAVAAAPPAAIPASSEAAFVAITEVLDQVRGIAWYYKGGFGLIHSDFAAARIVQWDSTESEPPTVTNQDKTLPEA